LQGKLFKASAGKLESSRGDSSIGGITHQELPAAKPRRLLLAEHHQKL
jgi:hypothetical protein